MLARPRARMRGISLVPLVDVLLILLVFFMVTSTYLDLDMLPVSASEGGGGAAEPGGTLFLRIDAGGRAVVQGAPLDPPALSALLAARQAADPGLRLLILPSTRAPVQALVSVMDRATAAGVTELRIVRIEAE